MSKQADTACKHPAPSLYSWVARDDTVTRESAEYDRRVGVGRVLVVVCLKCHTVLRGGA